MVSDYPPPRSGIDLDLVRDLLAVVLVVAGCAGALWASFATDWRLGVGVLSVMAIVGGSALAYRG